MIFPFQISFKEQLDGLSDSNKTELLQLIRKNVIYDERAIKEIHDDQNDFHFKTYFWKLGLSSDYVGVGSGRFNIMDTSDPKKLVYSYRTGGYQEIGVFIIISAILIAVSHYVDGTAISLSRLRFPVCFSIAGCFILWLAALFQQNRLFRRIVREYKLLVGHP
jgi:hypothetical protein